MGHLTPQKIAALADLLSRGIESLRLLTEIGDGLQMAVSEGQRSKSSLKKGYRPLEWSEFLEAAHKLTNGLGELLEVVEVKKFDLGRLFIMTDGYAYTALSLHREQIRTELQRQYGVPFRVRIICREK